MTTPPPSERHAPSRHPCQTLAWIVSLSAAVFALGFVPLRASYDEWWHLKSGRYIWEHGLPENDVFTYTAEDMPWHNHEWLSQVLLWKVFEFGELHGSGGIRILQTSKTVFILLSYLGLGLFLSRNSGSPALAGLAVMIGFALSRRTMAYFRPPFLSSGILILLMVALLHWRMSDKRRMGLWLGVLPFVFALWANLHGGFMAGLVILGAFWGEAVADLGLAHWRREPVGPARASLGWMSALLAACVIGTFANPYGWRLYELAARVMGDKMLVSMIFELQPPDWNFVWIVDAVIVLLAATLARPAKPMGWLKFLGVCLPAVYALHALPRFALDDRLVIGAWLREILVLLLLTANALRASERAGFALWSLNVFFAHQAIQHVRHLPLWGIVLAPFLLSCFADWMEGGVMRPPSAKESPRETQQRRVWMPRAASCLTVFLALFYMFWPGEVLHSIETALASPAEFLRQPLLGSNLRRNLDLMKGVELQRGEYPVEAVDHLVATSPPGRLWNAANYAGYLIWRLSPEKYRVFTDTRYDIWGGKFLMDEAVVRDGFPGDPGRGIPSWESVLERWKVNTIFVPVEAGLHSVLKAPGAGGLGTAWRLDYADTQFAIWIRTHPLGMDDPAEKR